MKQTVNVEKLNRKSPLCSLLGQTLALLFLLATTGPAVAAGDSPPLCVMSYNLRFASPTGDNAWPDRRPIMKTLIKKVAPDLIGTQEGLYQQIQDIASDCPEYSWIGVGRDDGVLKGEFMAIFYRKALLQPLQTNHFWLSDTPEVAGSATWGNEHKRLVTWVKFKNLKSGKEFYHFNTHFDHRVQVAREKSAELVRRRVAALKTALPVILTGDFNAKENNKAHAILVQDGFFQDTWYTARERRGEGLSTFNGFKAIDKTGSRIDWILTRGKVEVDATEIVTFSQNNHFPSDHCPLVAWVRF